MKEWPVGMNESYEDVSGSCLRINPIQRAVSRAQIHHTQSHSSWGVCLPECCAEAAEKEYYKDANVAHLLICKRSD